MTRAHSPATPLVRPPTAQEARRIAEINIRSWQASYRELLSPGFLAGLDQGLERRMAFFGAAIDTGSPALRVAESAGQLVGFCCFGASRDADATAGTGELMAFYLLPHAWGQGIGLQLWQAARQSLLQDGYHAVTAWALDGNARAARFYQRAGFMADASSQRTFEENGEPLPLTRFHLQLAPSA